MKCQCSKCGAFFGGVTAFDMHRVGDYNPGAGRRCRTAVEMAQRGLFRDDTGKWCNRGPKSILAQRGVAVLFPGVDVYPSKTLYPSEVSA